MSTKRILSNRKAQEEIGMAIVALGLIILMGMLGWYYFVVLKGNIQKGSQLPFVEKEHAISTTNYLTTALNFRDDYGIAYSTLIGRSIDRPSGKHPNGENYGQYFENNIESDICNWLAANLVQNTYHFSVMVEDAESFSCGVTPIEENLFIETQFLPLSDGRKATVALETWVL